MCGDASVRWKVFVWRNFREEDLFVIVNVLKQHISSESEFSFFMEANISHSPLNQQYCLELQIHICSLVLLNSMYSLMCSKRCSLISHFSTHMFAFKLHIHKIILKWVTFFLHLFLRSWYRWMPVRNFSRLHIVHLHNVTIISSLNSCDSSLLGMMQIETPCGNGSSTSLLEDCDNHILFFPFPKRLSLKNVTWA